MVGALRRGARGVRVPSYDFVSNSRRPSIDDTVLSAPRLVIFEGILALYDPRLRDLFDLNIFVDADADVRLVRRIRRDITERGRDVAGVLRQYAPSVEPALDDLPLCCLRDEETQVRALRQAGD